MRISFMDAINGVNKKIQLNQKDVCPHCNGSGARPGTQPQTCTRCNGSGQIVQTQQSIFGTVRNVTTCPECRGAGKVIKEKCINCGGSGYVSSNKNIEISIPAGIDSGQSVRIPGKGEPGTNGGSRGDLLVNITVDRHPIFQRQGFDIYSTVPISFADAALGGDITIKTVDGDVTQTIKAGTQTDSRITLRGKGVPTLRNKNVRGNHYVTLVVQVPEHLNSDQREALRAFDATMKGKKYEGKKRGFIDKFKDAVEDLNE